MMKVIVAVVFLCVLGLAGSALANPGTSSALNGVEDVYTGFQPPPGFYLMNYTLYYGAGAINDDKGVGIPGAKVTMIADAVRLVYSSDIDIFGGRAMWHCVIPLVHKDITVPPPGIDESLSGLGDMYVSPLLVGWSFSPEWHIIAGLDMILPTGEFERSRLVGTSNPNIGSHHYTFEPALAATRIFSDIGLVLDAKLMYDIHTREEVTQVRTGNQFHVDYAATLPIAEKLRAGINGYWFTSCEEDKLGRDTIDDSKERVFAIGPIVRYDVNEHTSLSFKAQFEQNAHNRPDGNAFWLKIVHGF